MNRFSKEKDLFVKGSILDKFVFHVPKWQGELFFSKELLVFVGVILLVIVGTLFCFWGYKFFRTVLFIGIGVVACCVSYLLVEPMTPKLVIRMFLTVSLTFLGLCFFYLVDIIFSYVLDKLHIRDALGKRTYLLAAPLGAAILGLTIYYFIWRDEITAAVISLVCLAVGLPFQYVKRKKQVRFRTYNDLLRLSRPEVNADEPEHVALGTVAALSAATALEPEPEPVIETIVPEPVPEHEPVTEAVKPEPAPESVIAPVEPAFVPEPAAPESDLLVVTLAPEPKAGSELPVELSDSAKELIHKKMDSKEDILEEAFFVRQINSIKKGDSAARAKSSQEGKTQTPSYQGKITVTSKHDGKFRRKRDKDIARGVAIVATGLGIFLAGRASKGGD